MCVPVSKIQKFCVVALELHVFLDKNGVYSNSLGLTGLEAAFHFHDASQRQIFPIQPYIFVPTDDQKFAKH